MTDAVRGNRNSVSVASNDSIVRAAREVLDAEHDAHLEPIEREVIYRRNALLLAAEVLRLREALECEHNRNVEADPERLWEYVEHKGKTWNRCRSCGLLELWEGGSFIGIDFAALASSPLEERSSSESKESVDSSDDSEDAR